MNLKKFSYVLITIFFVLNSVIFAQANFPMAQKSAKIPKPKSNFSKAKPNNNKPPFGNNNKPPFGNNNKPPFDNNNKPPFGNNNKPPFGSKSPIPFDLNNLKMPSIPVDDIFSSFPKDYRSRLKKELGNMKAPNVESMFKEIIGKGKKPPLDPQFWEGLIYSAIVSKAMFAKGDLRKNNIPADLFNDGSRMNVDPEVVSSIVREYAKFQNLPAEYEEIMKTILENGYGVKSGDESETATNSDGYNQGSSQSKSSNEVLNYFFKNNQLMLYSSSAKKKAGPKNTDTQWSGLWSDGVDAAVNWGDGYVYFFKGSQWMRFDSRSKAKDQGPSAIKDFWPDLWPDGVDAAVNWGNGYVFFFKGDKVIRYTTNPQEKDEGPVAIKSWFSGLPSSGIDAAFNYNNENIYFLKNKYAIRFDIDTVKKIEHFPITDKWSSLWERDIDAATFWTSSE